MFSLWPARTLEKRLSIKKYKAGVANIHINDDDEDMEPEEVEEAIGLIQCAFIQCYGSELNPNHIYLDTCTTFSQVIKKEFLKMYSVPQRDYWHTAMQDLLSWKNFVTWAN